MNDKTLKSYLGMRMRQLNIVGNLKPEEIEKLATIVITAGVHDFWNAGDWTFKRKLYELDTSSSSETYDLPNNFASMIAIREKISMSGKNLVYLVPDEFWNKVPDVTTHPGGSPTVYTIYLDNRDYKISFYPIPSDTPMYCYMNVEAPDTAGSIPARATAALLASIDKYLFKPGTDDFQSAAARSEYEIKRLENRDVLNEAFHTTFIDDSDRTLPAWGPLS